jgi:hypothetical protein
MVSSAPAVSANAKAIADCRHTRRIFEEALAKDPDNDPYERAEVQKCIDRGWLPPDWTMSECIKGLLNSTYRLEDHFIAAAVAEEGAVPNPDGA